MRARGWRLTAGPPGPTIRNTKITARSAPCTGHVPEPAGDRDRAPARPSKENAMRPSIPFAILIVVTPSGGGPLVAQERGQAVPPPAKQRVEIRGIYGGVPTQILDRGRTLADYGVN